MGVVFGLFTFVVSFLVCNLSFIVVYSSRQFILANSAIPGELLEDTLVQN